MEADSFDFSKRPVAAFKRLLGRGNDNILRLVVFGVRRLLCNLLSFKTSQVSSHLPIARLLKPPLLRKIQKALDFFGEHLHFAIGSQFLI